MPKTLASRSKRLTKRNPQWFWVSNDWTIVCFLTHRRDDNFLTGKPNSELPEGTAASVPFCLVHKDHRNFLPCPELFLPERWLSQEKRENWNPIFSMTGFPTFSTKVHFWRSPMVLRIALADSWRMLKCGWRSVCFWIGSC